MPDAPGQKLAQVGAHVKADQGHPTGLQPPPAQDHPPGPAIHHDAEHIQAHPQQQPQPTLQVEAELQQLMAVAEQGRQHKAKAEAGDPGAQPARQAGWPQPGRQTDGAQPAGETAHQSCGRDPELASGTRLAGGRTRKLGQAQPSARLREALLQTLQAGGASGSPISPALAQRRDRIGHGWFPPACSSGAGGSGSA